MQSSAEKLASPRGLDAPKPQAHEMAVFLGLKVCPYARILPNIYKLLLTRRHVRTYSVFAVVVVGGNGKKGRSAIPRPNSPSAPYPTAIWSASGHAGAFPLLDRGATYRPPGGNANG